MTTTKHRIRRDNAEFHMTTLKQNRGYATEQGKVWAHVADMSHQMAAPGRPMSPSETASTE